MIWPIKELGEACEIITPGIKRFDGVKKYVATADVEFDKIINFSKITFENRPSRANVESKKNDVLVAKMAATQKFLIADEKLQKEHIFSTGFAVLRAKEEFLLSKYLFYFLTTKYFNLQKDRLATGATQKAINNSRLKKVKIKIPLLPIQQKIVKRLDAIRKAQELNEKQIALADELFQSLLYKELKPKKNWEIKKLGEVAEIIMGQSPPSSSYNDKGKGLPFFQGKAEFGEIYPIPVKHCSSPSRIAEANDILMSVRAPVGNINLAKERSCIGRGLAALRAKENILDQMFLYYLMKKNENNWSRLSVGSTFSAIRRNNLENLDIPLPQMKAQKQIVEKLSAVQDYKKKLLEQKELLQELFESTLNKAMKGEL